MRTDPVNRKITPEDAALLANIFRVIIREVRYDEDKEKLLPGEIGINYKEGAFYIRNPHTGELFSPNSLEHIKLILTKYNPNNNTMNADTVGGVKWYTSLTDLEPLGLYQWTPDSVIRQMEYPAIMWAPVEVDNPKSYGWPGNAGTLYVRKYNEEFVTANFYDTETYVVYEARYNRFKHLFEGWSVVGGNQESIYTETVGGGDHTDIYIDKELKDLMILIVRVTETLNPGATVSVNDGKPLPIFHKDGQRLAVEIAPNNIIMLIYDEQNQRWILAESTDSSTRLLLNITNQRIKNLKEIHEADMERLRQQLNAGLEELEDTIDELKKDHDQDILTLTNRIEALETRPGIINAVISNVAASADGITRIAEIEGFNGAVDKLVVNYEQTILRIGVDYRVVGNGIELINDISLYAGDVVQFIVLKQSKSKGVS